MYGGDSLELNSSTTGNTKIEVVNFKTLSKDSFIELIQENKLSLYRLSKSILKNEADIQDAMSETIIKAYVNIHKLRLMYNFKPWIMKILVNECYNIIRKHKKVELTDDFSAYEGSYEDKTENNLMFYVNQLEDEFKSVIILFYYDDISIKSISAILNISEGTVKSRLSRAKVKLKISMENDCRGDCFE
jgi:RNA polymerase sigma-70 factor, ECF subfamily